MKLTNIVCLIPITVNKAVFNIIITTISEERNYHSSYVNLFCYNNLSLNLVFIHAFFLAYRSTNYMITIFSNSTHFGVKTITFFLRAKASWRFVCPCMDQYAFLRGSRKQPQLHKGQSRVQLQNNKRILAVFWLNLYLPSSVGYCPFEWRTRTKSHPGLLKIVPKKRENGLK